MYKLKSFQSFFTIFFISGLSSFISFTDPKKKNSSIVNYLLRTLNISLNSLIFYVLSNDIFNSNLSLVSNFTSIPLLFPNYVAVFENIFVAHQQSIILRIICFTIDNFEQYLEIQFPLDTLRKCFRRKFFLQFIILFIGIFIKLIAPTNVITGLNWFIGWSVSIALIFQSMHVLHITFYIDFITLSFETLSEKIVMLKNQIDEKSFQKESNDEDRLHVMHQIKIIHFKLWHISQRLNSIFGWFLMTFLCDVVYCSTFSLFRTFYFVASPIRVGIAGIRKYTFRFFVTFKTIYM